MTETVEAALANRDWLRIADPFPHFVADDVFVPAFHAELSMQFRGVLERGLAESRASGGFSRNMANSGAYGWNFPPDLTGPLGLFYGAPWHRLLCALTAVAATADVNGAAHHHPPGSGATKVHTDLDVCWFSDQPRADGINPMDLSRCGYTSGQTSAGAAVRRVVRAVTMIYFLCNDAEPSGGETGLFRDQRDGLSRPAARVSPRNNRLLVFANNPAAHHAFLGTGEGPRNSVIMWLHRPFDAALADWGSDELRYWHQTSAPDG